LKPKDIISVALDYMIGENIYYREKLQGELPEEEIDWANQLILSRMEELDLEPTESELYTLMKIRMKV
jgi:hypothetical protein